MTKGYEVGKTYKVVSTDKQFSDKLNNVFICKRIDGDDDCWGQDKRCYSVERIKRGSVVEWDVDNNRPMSETIKLNQENKMSNTNIKQMQDQLEQAQKRLAELQKQLEDTKKKEQNVFGIGKNVDGVGFYVDQDHGVGFDSNWTNNRLLNEQYTFSTQRQAGRFAEAFRVLMELRSCEGVVVPDDKNWYHFVKCTKQDLLEYENLQYSRYGAVSPCFSSEYYAKAAVQKVGEQRVIDAIKTLTGLPE